VTPNILETENILKNFCECNNRADWNVHYCHNGDQPSLNSPERQLRDNMNNNNSDQQGYNINNHEPNSYSAPSTSSFCNYQNPEVNIFEQSFEYDDGRSTKIENIDQSDSQKWDSPFSRLNCLDNPEIWNSPLTMNMGEGGQERWNPLCQTPSLTEAILETDKYLVRLFNYFTLF
jgi:hypothetical protein